MSVKFEIKGVEDVQKFLGDKNKATKSNAQKGLRKAAIFMHGEVKESIAGRRSEPTSVDTGRLLNSVDLNVGQEDAIIYTDIEYSKYLEYGTEFIHPRQHFQNSKSRNQSKAIEIIETEIKNI